MFVSCIIKSYIYIRLQVHIENINHERENDFQTNNYFTNGPEATDNVLKFFILQLIKQHAIAKTSYLLH